ncbi:MAG TPA: peptidoglycan-binding protein [Acidimicrobiales bacterium]|jgi:hypothetical protein
MPTRSPRTSTPKLVRVTFGCSVAVLASLIGLAVQGGSAEAAAVPTPVVPAGLGRAIEAPSPYIPQTDCDLVLRQGTVALMRLLQRTYQDGSNLGILQSCAAEGITSEHSDGRALDFGLNVKNPRQHAEADAFLQWLFATDRFGNKQAMARRLGVMYVIYNGQIRSIGDSGYSPYDPSVCSGGRGDATTCHRNHIHISLSWAGALGHTSFWTGRVAAVDYGPCVAPGHLFSAHYTKPNPQPCPPAPLRPLPTLSLKARGPSVVLIQRILRVQTDGIYGPITAKAVLAWRKSHHLSTSKSVVDPAMWTSLSLAGQLN